jgi:ribosomal protein L40E
VSVVDALHPAASVCPQCGTANRPDAAFCRSCGTRLLEQSAATHESTRPTPAETSGSDSVESSSLGPVRIDIAGGLRELWAQVRRIRRRWWLIAVVVIVAAGATITFTVDRVVYPPDRAVRAFFAALAAHDAVTAGQLAGCSDAPLCSGTALTSGYTAPAQLQIGAVSSGPATDLTRRPDESVAYMHVRYQLAGQPVDAVIELARDSTGTARPWHILGGGYGYLDVVSTTTSRAQVAGVSVPAVTAASSLGAQQALPGVYTVTAATTDPLFGATPQQVSIIGQLGTTAPAEVDLVVGIRPTVLATVQHQVDASMDRCAAGATDVLAIGCPFELTDTQVPYYPGDDVVWKITKYPQVKLELSADPDSDGGPIVVHTATAGVVVATWPGGSLTETVDPGGVVTAGLDGQPVYTR